jgi:hypothetical protein
MAGFLWFVPDCKDLPIDAVIAKAGLEELLCEGDDKPGISDSMIAGPDGVRGRFLTYGPRNATADRPIAYKPAEQTWKRASKRGELAAGRYWVGMWNAAEARPTPAELRRNVMLLGPKVTLAAGGPVWEIALADQMPRKLGVNDDGAMVKTFARARHKAYFDRAWELIHKVRESASDGLIRFDLDEHFRFAADALALNYRVNVDALTLLEVIDSDLVFGVAQAAAGFPSLDSDAKKQGPEPSIAPGGSGSGNAAGEPSAN